MDTEKLTIEEKLRQEHYKSPKPVLYALVTLGGNLAGRILLTFLTTGSGKNAINMGLELFVTLVSLVVPLYLLYMYFRSADVSKHYREGVHWAKSFFWLAFPGELIRFILSISGVTGRFFSYTGWQLMTLLYVYPQRDQGDLGALLASTAIVYPLFNLLALALYLLPLLWLYRRYWLAGQKEWEKLKKSYAEHEAEAEKRNEIPEVEAKVIPSHLRQNYDTFNRFHGERKRK